MSAEVQRVAPLLSRYGLRRRRRLLRRWDGKCCLCGEPFETLESVTREHLVPYHLGGRGTDNIAPSHHSCNQARGRLGFLEGCRRVAAKLARMDPGSRRRWLNAPAPGTCRQPG